MLTVCQEEKDCFVRVRKRELEKLITEVMQLKEFLPKVVNKNLTRILHRAQASQTMFIEKEHLVQEKEKLQQECFHLQSRLCAAQSECQKEREEKLLLRDQLWQSRAELQQQVSFCSGLGSVTCGLLWSCSANEDMVVRWAAESQLDSFVAVAAQTLGSFVRSLDEDTKTTTGDQNPEEHQFLLALAGIITNVAAVTSGRDFLATSAHVLLDTLMELLGVMKPGVLAKLKVLTLMALYNVSISVKGLKHIIKNPGLLGLIRTLLDDTDWEVCLHALRLLQSVLLEEDVLLLLGSSLLDPDVQTCISRLSVSVQPSVRETALQTLEDLHTLRQGVGCDVSKP